MPSKTSSQSKTTTKLSEPDVIRQFVNGPCAREARIIVEEVGVFNIHSDEFDDALETLRALESEPAHSQVEKVVQALFHSSGPITPDEALELGRLLDNAHIDTVMRQREVAYLLGVAVGRHMGGGR